MPEAPSRRAVLGALPAVLPVLLLAGCAADGPPPLRGPVRLATGFAGGVYNAYGAGYAGVIARRFPEVRASLARTDGSVANLRMVAGRRAEAGFALADVASDALAGRRSFDEPLPVAALAALYDNYVQVVVRAEGGVGALADLAGRKVSLGGTGSGTAVVAERILRIAGVEREVEAVNQELLPSVDALARERIDALFWSGGLPSEAISRVRDRVPVRLLDLRGVVEKLVESYGELYTETTVPASVYRLPGPVTTVSVPNYLVVRADLANDTAYWMTRLLFEGRDTLARAHPEANRLDPGSAVMTYPLALHPGAARWYRETYPWPAAG